MPLTLNPVAPGDTLWDLAERAYGNGADYTLIAQANGITNPDLITPGQVLTIPALPQYGPPVLPAVVGRRAECTTPTRFSAG
jgi:hypothetical protein